MFLIIFILWLIFSGSINLTSVISGLIVSFLITFFCIKIFGYRLYTPKRFIKKAARVILYVLFLLKEIVLANLAVLKILYGKKEPEAVLVHFKGKIEGDGLQTLVANSITLTPGTITVELRDGEYTVHALDKSLAEDLPDLNFFDEAAKFEKI